MPHDANGEVLMAGDTVGIPCKVERVDAAGDFCNVLLKSVYAMPGNKTNADGGFNSFTLNAAQVVKYAEQRPPAKVYCVTNPDADNKVIKVFYSKDKAEKYARLEGYGVQETAVTV